MVTYPTIHTPNFGVTRDTSLKMLLLTINQGKNLDDD
jgi:hypothetical protein